MKKKSLLALSFLWLASIVSSFAVQSNVPTPESVLGYQIGADFKLASYEDSIGYFRQLDAASDRLQLVEIGRTSFNRPWYIALISSPENLANVERFDLPHLTFHGLRHAFATLALQAGMNPKVVSEALGHSSVTITLDTYSHVLPNMQDELAIAVEDLLKRS